jgi:uncharacterized protein (DUF1501 family)
MQPQRGTEFSRGLVKVAPGGSERPAAAPGGRRRRRIVVALLEIGGQDGGGVKVAYADQRLDQLRHVVAVRPPRRCRWLAEQRGQPCGGRGEVAHHHVKPAKQGFMPDQEHPVADLGRQIHSPAGELTDRALLAEVQRGETAAE